MATVNFTLDELLEATNKQTRGILAEVLQKEVRQVLRKEFKPLFDDAFEPYAQAIQQDFNRVHERLDGLEHEMKSVKRVVNQHSVEILELKAQLN